MTKRMRMFRPLEEAMRNAGRMMASAMTAAVVVFSAAASMSAAPAESARMLRAKDLISEDQWVAAIRVLKAAAADPREQNKDEALFWLAHSQNQAGALTESFETIRRLQREYPKSRWSAPASSLLIELAQKLGQKEFLWWAATPPAPPPVPPPTRPVRGVRPRFPTPRASAPAPPPAPPAPLNETPPAPPPAVTPARPAAVMPAPPPPPPAWVGAAFHADVEVKVQALSGLMKTDAPKVIPILRNIVLEYADQSAARGAVFVLAQSRNPDAHRVVVDVAMSGPEALRPVAVRDLALFGDSNVSLDLLRVYSVAPTALKLQVVSSLGQRADVQALFKIVTSEHDPSLRERAIVALGRAGGSDDLRLLYGKGSSETRQAIVTGLCNARDTDGLIGIADQEKDANIRRNALDCLRLMGTARAKVYLSKEKK
jgi:hypothetical protein